MYIYIHTCTHTYIHTDIHTCKHAYKHTVIQPYRHTHIKTYREKMRPSTYIYSGIWGSATCEVHNAASNVSSFRASCAATASSSRDGFPLDGGFGILASHDTSCCSYFACRGVTEFTASIARITRRCVRDDALANYLCLNDS